MSEKQYNNELVQLPDPRRYGAGLESHAFNQLADRELRIQLRDELTQDRDVEIRAALRAAPDQAAYKRLWESVYSVAHHFDTEAHSHVFALPLVIVIGARQAGTIAGVLSDSAAIAAMLRSHGVIAGVETFALSAALCTAPTLENIPFSDIYKWTHSGHDFVREVTLEPIVIDSSGESVHLRFLVGSAPVVTSMQNFVAAASNIGSWGMPITRALAAQFASSGVEVLPLPRAPLPLLQAIHVGSSAHIETAFNLFVSNALRRMRMSSGDPTVTIAAYANDEIRVSFKSRIDDTVAENFHWSLHALDDLRVVTASILNLLEECRIDRIEILPSIQAVNS